MIPVIGFARPLYRWLRLRRIDQLHRSLGGVEREFGQNVSNSRLAEYQMRIREIESAVGALKVARTFEVDVHRLRVHLRMVQEDLSRLKAEYQSKDHFACPPEWSLQQLPRK